MLAFLLACAPDPEPEKGRDRCEIVIRYGDADGDGFGDVEAPVAGCDPAGVDDAGDCDDADPATHPGAQESCDQPVDRDCDGQIGFADDDGDGWAACEDCDDADPWVHPEAEEICDWIDQDCDALVDEDPMDGLAFYVDADGDGYGDDATLELACSEMADRVDEGGDCDDADPRVNPDEDERCDPDDVDEDCDGLSDESGADDEEQFWLDDDEDGYGDRGTWVFACDWPDGYVGNDEDCDDADGGVNPDATETCDGEDEDCDRLVDDDADGAPTWYFDDDGDGYGDATVTMLSCSAPRSDWVEDATDCDDADAATHPGADEACDGEDDDCDGSADEAGATDEPTWYADADGDGYGDAASTTTACDAPSGWVAEGTDCDDADAGVSPAATERCDGVDQDCDGAVDDGGADGDTFYGDADGDGFGDAGSPVVDCALPAGASTLATDCDDGDAAVSPDGVEVCDGVDQDCDGDVDEDGADAPSWYADVDGDGFGDATVVTVACDAPAAFVADDGDCDDLRADTFPGAPEPDCSDPTDYNCDGSTGAADADGDGAIACLDCDDADASVQDGLPWYADGDGDGYGDAATTSASCLAADGWVADATDCDDADPAVFPGATETCATEVDDDCDGDTNDRDADGCGRWYLDDDGDGYGSTTNRCYCERVDAWTALSATDCDDGDAAVSPGAEEAWGNGVDDDCDETVDVVGLAGEGLALPGEGSSDYAGLAVAMPGDMDGDGYDELVVGSYRNDRLHADGGAAGIVRGPVDASVNLASVDARWRGDSAGDYAGYAVAGAGDVDGDGLADVLVGAYADDDGAAGAGAAHVLTSVGTSEEVLSDAAAKLVGTDANDALGISVAGAGDVDGDGYGDVLAGAHLVDDARSDAGAAYLFRGPLTGDVAAASADATLLGDQSSDFAGASVAGGEDLDGDGLADLAVGAYGAASSNEGRAYVFSGPVTGTLSLTTADAQITGSASSDQVGRAMAMLPDADGDGYAELFLGAYQAGTDGEAYLFAGPLAATAETADAAATFVGSATTSQYLGYAVSPAGDLDGDGTGDVLLGDHGATVDVSGQGAAFLFYGPHAGTRAADDADATLFGEATSDAAGVAVAGGGDVDGDGVPDLLVGAYRAGSSDAGAAYLLYGP